MTRKAIKPGRPYGERHLFADFTSGLVRPRNITVWLPPGHDTGPHQRYPVIYAHDGQNLFDPATAFTGVDWGIDEAMGRLLAEGTVREALVVGIWNTPGRYREYDPQKVVDQYLSQQERAAYVKQHGRPRGDRYLEFIVQELKPFIDSRFRTLPGRADTLLLGSSMGGIISAYGVCEYPEVFSAAACLSTHWPAGNGKMIDYLADRLPDPLTHRFYFDFGTETTDAQYEPWQRQVDRLLRRNAYSEGSHWVTRKFSGADHSERAWRRRVDIPLRFLLQ